MASRPSASALGHTGNDSLAEGNLEQTFSARKLL